ncbi:hypothetical protein LINPERPRIM_LOCUS21459 [Linum perenne]
MRSLFVITSPRRSLMISMSSRVLSSRSTCILASRGSSLVCFYVVLLDAQNGTSSASGTGSMQPGTGPTGPPYPDTGKRLVKIVRLWTQQAKRWLG